jgi:hypothetical protein
MERTATHLCGTFVGLNLIEQAEADYRTLKKRMIWHA